MIRRIRKRDGRLVDFDQERLAASLAAALRTAGLDDAYAPWLADGVALSLGTGLGVEEGGGEPGVVDADRLHRAVAKALEDTGHPAAADAWRDWRLRRLAALERIRVHGEEQGIPAARSWDRARLARSLERRHRLDPDRARLLARRVEGRVLAAGWTQLDAALLEALVAAEARLLGWSCPAAGDRGLGPGRAELREWLAGEVLPGGAGDRRGSPALLPPGHDLRPALGSELLARFALEELLPPAAARAVLGGEIDLPLLGDWTRPARILARPRTGGEEGGAESETAFWERVARLRDTAHETQVYWPRGHPFSDLTVHAPRWLRHPHARIGLGTGDADLALAWLRQGFWVRMPRRALEEAPAARVRALMRERRLLLVWHPWAPRLSARQERPEAVVHAAAVVHLEAAARDCAEGATGTFLEEVARRIQLAARACRRLAERAGMAEPWRLSLQPAGLPGACRRLLPGAGPEELRPLLQALREAFHRLPRPAGFRVEHLAPPHSEGAGLRLAERQARQWRGLADRALPVGWNPREDGQPPDPGLMAVIPWLEWLPPRREAATPEPGRTRESGA